MERCVAHSGHKTRRTESTIGVATQIFTMKLWQCDGPLPPMYSPIVFADGRLRNSHECRS
eukprot:829021-Pelagomonas_calceolata.AAC.3